MSDGSGLTVGGVADLVGVSVRTLHHWDEIGLITPSSRTAAGYRSYSSDDIGRLHRVLVYRELGFSLAQIAEILDDPEVDVAQHLREQRRLLDVQITNLSRMAAAVDQTLALRISGTTVSVREQADIFGRGWRDEWADEARDRWGSTDEWRQFEENASALTASERTELHRAGEALYDEVAAAMRSGTAPASTHGRALAERHRAMIGSLYSCTPSMHAVLGRMYVDDPRFRDSLDATEPGLSVWLCEAIYAAVRVHGVDPASAQWE